MKYLRFAGFTRDDRTWCSVGLFQIAYGLVDGHVDDYLHSELAECLDWFHRNLPAPDRLYRPGRNRYAVSWFRSTARPWLRMARRLVIAVEEAGIPIQTLRTATPGYVVYQDAHQVVAVPFQTC